MKITLFGATGSIGQQVIQSLKNTKHKLVGISYYNNEKLAKKIKVNFSYSPKYKSNISSYEELIFKSKPDLIINAISGFAGLEISLLAIENKIDLALANKESIVTAGKFLFEKAKQNNVQIYPIDSEHTSLMYILKNHNDKFKEIYITASGGLFYNKNNLELKNINYKQVINHPTWKMGEKISIDSSTLMNKCFEIIECYWYFKTKKINVLYHPQSNVHAIVKYKNQSLACVYQPSMIVPIKMVLNNFKNFNDTIEKINLKTTNYHLKKIKDLLPIKWAYQVINKPNSSLPIILNAANEFFVEAFKNNNIKYIDIINNINKVIKKIPIKQVKSIQGVYDVDHLTRQICHTVL